MSEQDPRDPNAPYTPAADAGYPPPSVPGGGPPDAPPAPKLPWEDRGRLGFGPALMQTISQFMKEPRAAFDRAMRKGDYGSPVLWILVLAFIALLAGFLWGLAFLGPMTGMMSAFMPAELREEFVASMAASVGVNLIVNLVSIPFVCLFTVAAAFILAAIYHVCLMLAGGSPQSESGFEGTFRAVSYGYTAQIANIIPLVGPLIAMIWGIVLMVVGMSSMHRISTGKAVVVVLIPLFFCCACVALVLAFSASAIIGAMGNR